MCKYYPLSGLCHMCSLCGEGYGDRSHQMIITTQLARHPCWATFYLWAPPWCDETCNVQGFLTNGHWVVPIPCICHCLIHTLWNMVCKVEGTGHMMGLTNRLTILWLQVHCAAIGKDHVVGVLGLTRSMKPIRMSLSRSAYTLSCQWSGTSAGLWMATVMALESTWSCRGSPFMSVSGWCSHILDVVTP